MKTWNELTEEQRIKAIHKVRSEQLQDITNGTVRFDDEKNGDNLQEAINAAIAEAVENQTPWFAHEYVMEARYNPGEGHITEDDGLWPVSELLQSLAMPIVEEALYPTKDEVTIRGIA